MYPSVTAVSRAVRQIIFENHAPGDSFCFSLDNTTDAGPNQRGDLFEQNGDFFLIEVEVDDVYPAGPGIHSPRRVDGGVDIRYLTKDRMDDLGAQQRLEDIGNWFSDQKLKGIQFGLYAPVGAGELLGFQRYSGTVPFSCDLKPKGAR